MSAWHGLRGYIAGLIGIISCPCHLVLTLPLLASLTAGTVFGVWLAHNFLLVGASSTGVFLISGALAFKWLGGPRSQERRL